MADGTKHTVSDIYANYEADGNWRSPPRSSDRQVGIALVSTNRAQEAEELSFPFSEIVRMRFQWSENERSNKWRLLTQLRIELKSGDSIELFPTRIIRRDKAGRTVRESTFEECEFRRGRVTGVAASVGVPQSMNMSLVTFHGVVHGSKSAKVVELWPCDIREIQFVENQ